MRRIHVVALLVGLVTIVSLAVCGPVLALYSSASERQVVPGITRHTIWGEAQVAVYRLPKNVTHVGNIHVELTYLPADRDCAMSLLDSTGAVVAGTYQQGHLGQWSGKEVIDYMVPAVVNSGWKPDGSDIQGDAYYVLVQALNATSYYRLRRYWTRTVAARWQYKAVASTRTATTPQATYMPASFGQYVYPKLWQAVGGALPVNQ